MCTVDGKTSRPGHENYLETLPGGWEYGSVKTIECAGYRDHRSLWHFVVPSHHITASTKPIKQNSWLIRVVWHRQMVIVNAGHGMSTTSTTNPATPIQGITNCRLDCEQTQLSLFQHGDLEAWWSLLKIPSWWMFRDLYIDADRERYDFAGLCRVASVAREGKSPHGEPSSAVRGFHYS